MSYTSLKCLKPIQSLESRYESLNSADASPYLFESPQTEFAADTFTILEGLKRDKAFSTLLG